MNAALSRSNPPPEPLRTMTTGHGRRNSRPANEQPAGRVLDEIIGNGVQLLSGLMFVSARPAPSSRAFRCLAPDNPFRVRGAAIAARLSISSDTLFAVTSFFAKIARPPASAPSRRIDQNRPIGETARYVPSRDSARPNRRHLMYPRKLRVANSKGAYRHPALSRADRHVFPGRQPVESDVQFFVYKCRIGRISKLTSLDAGPMARSGRRRQSIDL